MKENFNEQKGITLTALVITIIVMLILVGVILVASVSENGVIDRATEALVENERAEIQELIHISMVYKETAAETTYSNLNMIETAKAIVKNLTDADYAVITTTGNVATGGEEIYTVGEESFTLNIQGKRAKYTGIITTKGLEKDIEIVENFSIETLSDIEALRKYFITGNSVIERFENPDVINNPNMTFSDIKFKNIPNIIPDAYTTISMINGTGVGNYFLGFFKYKDNEYMARMDGEELICQAIDPVKSDILAEDEENEKITEVATKYEEYLEIAKLKGQTKKDIGIGTDGEIVNLDYWNYSKRDDDGNSLRLGEGEGSWDIQPAYNEEYLLDGKIQGKMPQYIYIKEDDKVYPVTMLCSLLKYWSDYSIGIIEIPEIPTTVNYIQGCAFRRMSIENITIPENVKIIGREAFKDCTKLKSISIPKNVWYIGEEGFYGCENLEEISLPEGIISLGYRVFGNCSKLNNVVLPSSLLEMGWDCFYDCTSLTSIRIPSKLMNIEEGIFCGCENLTSVYLEQTKVPTFNAKCFWKETGIQTVFYFKNSAVSDALTEEHYNTAYGTKSTDYTWE